MKWSRWIIGSLFATCCALLAVSDPVFAHAQLISSNPDAGAVLTESPTSLLLTFSEDIEVSLVALELFDGAGSAVDVGSAVHPQGHAEQVEVKLPRLANGSYVVDWKVVSVDSHVVHSAFTFQVGPQSTLTNNLLDEILGRSSDSRAVGTGLAIIRALVAISICVVLGGLVSVGWGIVGLSRRLRLVMLVGTVVGVVAGLVALPLESGYAMGQSLDVVFDPVAWRATFDSKVGRAWVLRSLTLGIAGIALTWAHTSVRSRWWRASVLGALGLVGIASAFGGHGAAGRWQLVGVLATAIHLGAVAIWLGGLLAVALCLDQLDDGAVRRLSRLALRCVGGVVASGAIQGLRQLKSWNALWQTDYGVVLVWKLLAFAVLMALAGLSRRAVAVRSGSSERPTGPPTVNRTQLRRSIGLEVGIAVVVFGVTSLLMGANPTVTNQSRSFSATLISNNYLASVVVEPARVGLNSLHLYIASPISSFDSPDSVRVEISDPTKSIAPISIPVSRAGAGHYTTSVVLFAYPAHWSLQVIAVFHTFDEISWRSVVAVT